MHCAHGALARPGWDYVRTALQVLPRYCLSLDVTCEQMRGCSSSEVPTCLVKVISISSTYYLTEGLQVLAGEGKKVRKDGKVFSDLHRKKMSSLPKPLIVRCAFRIT